MPTGNLPYKAGHIFSSMLMLALLTWLTVCLPFVHQSQKNFGAQTELTCPDVDSDNNNPLSNTNEEKSESGTSLLAEYLHDTALQEHNFITLSSFFKCHPSGIYIAYHPDGQARI